MLLAISVICRLLKTKNDPRNHTKQHEKKLLVRVISCAFVDRPAASWEWAPLFQQPDSHLCAIRAYCGRDGPRSQLSVARFSSVESSYKRMLSLGIESS